MPQIKTTEVETTVKGATEDEAAVNEVSIKTGK